MLLLGEGGPKKPEEGVKWLERAGEMGEYKAFRLLVDCYENGYCDVPVDSGKAALWRKVAGAAVMIAGTNVLELAPAPVTARQEIRGPLANCGSVQV